MACSRFRPANPAAATLYQLYNHSVEDLIRKDGRSPKETVDQTAHDAQVALDEAWAKIEG